MIIKKRFHSVVGFVATAGFLLTLALTSNLQAQTAEPAATPASPTAGTGIENQGQLQTVTVTGYIVPRVGEGTQPVSTIDETFIENQGDQTVSDVIQKLPQNTGAFTQMVNAGASFSPGGSTANLYGVGFSSTLVLIDGFRLTNGPFPQNGFEPFVDLNTIPLSAVDRIEILKDGASSIYGSDAIAGVINVLMKDEYNGVDIRYHYGISQRGDYEEDHVQLTAGISQKLWSDDSKLSIVASFDYDETSPILAIDRPYSSNVNHSLLSPQYSDLQSARTPAGNFIGLNTGNLYSVFPGSAGPFFPSEFVLTALTYITPSRASNSSLGNNESVPTKKSHSSRINMSNFTTTFFISGRTSSPISLRRRSPTPTTSLCLRAIRSTHLVNRWNGLAAC